MNKGDILVTDTLFIFPEHEEKLRAAGYNIVRVAKPDSSEDELCEHVQGKVGYILGGIEKVTERVIESADCLRAIVFTGADAIGYVPGMGRATEKGIAVACAPGANAYAVAEYTTAIILAMTRDLFEVGRTGSKTFYTAKSLKDQTAGIVGLGNIGTRVAKAMIALGAKRVVYWNRTRKNELETDGLEYVSSLDALLACSDVVTLHAAKGMGDGYVTAEKLALMHDDALIVNCSFVGAIDNEALFAELSSGRLRAMQDDPVDERFAKLPLYNWFSSNSHTGYNTEEANRTASDMSTESILSLLETGKDEYRVN